MKPHICATPRLSPASFSKGFAEALLDPSLPVPAGWVTWNGSDPLARFAIYRNNVAHSLVTVLADTFPVVRQGVGEAFFGAMALQFVSDHPPESPLMHRYGARLPSWLETFAPAGALPYLADLARLEWARLQAFHAADAAPIDEHALQAARLAPERLAAAVLSFHPSMSVVQSAYPVVSFWSAHQHDDASRDRDLSQLDMTQAEAAVVFRNAQDDAIVLGLPGAQAVAVIDLAAGAPLGAAQLAHPDADWVRLLSQLLRHGLITGLSYHADLSNPQRTNSPEQKP